jgi:rhodanese-related sulfurtransferase
MAKGRCPSEKTEIPTRLRLSNFHPIYNHGRIMAKTFMQMASDAMEQVPSLSPAEAQRRLRENPDAMLIDVRDLSRIRETGMASGAVAVSAGTLPVRADKELPEDFRDPRLQDRSRPVMTICDMGPMAAISAKTLKEMGFTDVAYVDGGMQAWKDAEFPTEEPRDQ